MTVNILAPDEMAEGHPFTDIARYHRDRQIMAYMLEDLRGLIGEMAEGTLTVTPYEEIRWTVHGLRRRTVVCDPMLVGERRDACVVGFFGERRPVEELNLIALEEADASVVLEFRGYPGILSYSSIELADGNWGNLVLHAVPEDRQAWRDSAAHAKAVAEIAPIHYQTVRIHNGTLPGGLMSGDSIEIDRTKYWDYRTDRIWQALRELPPADR